MRITLGLSLLVAVEAICPHEAAGLLLWDEPATWPDGALPVAGAAVTLPAGKSILVRSSPGVVLGEVTVPSTSKLVLGRSGAVGDAPILFNSTGITVEGSLIAGSADCPINWPRLEITLHGSRGPTPDSNAARSFSYKGIFVTGTLDLHGAPLARSWTRLAAPASAGESSVTLQDAVDWPVGGEVLVVTTALKDSRDWHRNEVRTLASLSNGGRTLGLASALSARHAATADYQGEVAYLTRAIVVQGAEADSKPTDMQTTCSDPMPRLGGNTMPCANSFLTGYGAHMVAVGTSAAMRVSSIELRRVGQTNVLGRYPFHLHRLGDAGQSSYIRGSSIHESYYRCVSIHGTNLATVDDNVAYDAIGHCFYLEDGVEERNTFSNNLAAHVHFIGSPARSNDGQQINSVSEDKASLLLPADVAASGFYITNAYNSIVNNAASGGWAGFAFPNLERPIKLHSTVKISPAMRPALAFDGNSAHSSAWWWQSAGMIYIGGSLKHEDPSDPSSPLIYNPGRAQPRDTCTVHSGWCSGSPCRCDDDKQGFLRITNSKLFLSASRGILNWGSRGEIVGLEVYDVALSASVLGVFHITNAIVACRSGEPLLLPCNGCETNVNTAASMLKNLDGVGFEWYDTSQQHILTDITFRRCGAAVPSRSPASGCGDGNVGCQARSSVWEMLTFSDQNVPEFMQATSSIKYEDCGRHFRFDNYILDYGGRYRNGMNSALAERLQNWYDADGSTTERGVPTIIGSSTPDSNGWWRLDLGAAPSSSPASPPGSGECDLSSEGPLWFCDASPNHRPAGSRTVGSMFLEWKPNQESALGGSICSNNNQKPCTAEGWIRHWGYAGGLPLTRNAEVAGPSGGFGWHMSLNGGAPRRLLVKRVQQFKSSVLLLSIAYPVGVGISVVARAAFWCTPSSQQSCSLTFTRVDSIDAVRSSLGNTFHVDDSGILYVRIVQPPKGRTGNPGWQLLEEPTQPFTRDGITIPTLSWHDYLEITSDCTPSSLDSDFCAATVSSSLPQACASGWLLVAYDRCCFADNQSICVGPGDALPTLTLSPSPPPPPPPPPSPSPSPPQPVTSECGLAQPFTFTETNLHTSGHWCSQVVPDAPFSPTRRDACERLYVGTPEYSAECIYVAGSGDSYKCKLRWPPFYPCGDGQGSTTSPPPPISPSLPPPPSPPPPPPYSPSPPPSPPPPSPPPASTGSASSCGLDQPYTLTETNLWDTGRWCGQLVTSGPFSAANRDVCERHYVGRPEYTAECIYVSVDGSTYRCKLRWPPIYPCEDGSDAVSPPPPPPLPPLLSPSPLSPSPSPAPSTPQGGASSSSNPLMPPPPSPPPASTGSASSCGLDQPYTLTETNLWDTGRWCGQLVTSGPFSAANRDVCERHYVGRPDYTAECIYVSVDGSTYRCKLRWPPIYPCEDGTETVSLPPPPSPSPLPPPPPSPPSSSVSPSFPTVTNVGNDCGLDQPFTLTKTNLWDSGRWCGQAVPTGAFSSSFRDACHGFYVGRSDYSTECVYTLVDGNTYRCKAQWPPYYPCR